MNKLLQVAMLGSSIAFAAGAQEPLPFLQPHDVILFQGDSITDGGRQRTGSDFNHIMGQDYAYILAAQIGAQSPQRELVFLNRGISGDRVPDLEARWQADTIALHPQLLSILIGVNDTWHHFMRNAGVPTASATLHTTIESAKRAVREVGTPIVVKASGLAAGKGVVVAHSIEEAERAIEMILGDRVFGDAGSEVLVEEFMEGEELSLFAITDGEFVVPMLPAQDHKRLLDDDVGPNTGGMGAYAPVSRGTPKLIDEITERIFLPTLMELKKENSKFTGVLYAGLMLTSEGPKVVEFNCRFGDPETQAILPLMKSSLLQLIDTVASGESLRDAKPIEWNDAYAVTTVLAAAGYPDSPRAGDAIRLPAMPSGIRVFHAGTKRGPATTELLTSGGRVFSITGVAPSLERAAECSREYAERVSFEGKQMRRDIGWRELERHARAT